MPAFFQASQLVGSSTNLTLKERASLSNRHAYALSEEEEAALKEKEKEKRRQLAELQKQWREQRRVRKLMAKETRRTMRDIREGAKQEEDGKWEEAERRRLRKKEQRHKNFSWMQTEQADMNEMMKKKLGMGGGGGRNRQKPAIR